MAEQGNCPKCGSLNLHYGVLEPDDTGIFYPVDCKDCNFIGKEHYNLEFAGIWDNDGNKC